MQYDVRCDICHEWFYHYQSSWFGEYGNLHLCNFCVVHSK